MAKPSDLIALEARTGTSRGEGESLGAVPYSRFLPLTIAWTGVAGRGGSETQV